MPELSVEADPRLWSVVPPESEAEPWLRSLLDGRTDEQQARILLAADLAVTAREAAPDSLVLLLCEPVSGLYATLGFLVTEAPAFRDAARAEELALTLTPSPWPPTTTPFTAGAVSGWRVTVLFSDEDAASDEQTGDAQIPDAQIPDTQIPDAQIPDGAEASPVTPLGWVRTTYVLDLDGRLVVGQLSPLSPEAGAVALALTEQLLPTLEIDHRG